MYTKPRLRSERDRLLSTAAVVLPLANLSALPRLLGVDVAMPHEVTGAHSTRRDVDPDLRTLLEAHNGLDIRLYQGAQALFERRMASLPRDNRQLVSRP